MIILPYLRDMFCCLGLIAALIVGEYTGVGNIVIPIGFISGIASDIIIFRHFFGKGKDKDESKSKQMLSCCNIFSHLNRIKKENH